jgi:hypothetical protein
VFLLSVIAPPLCAQAMDAPKDTPPKPDQPADTANADEGAVSAEIEKMEAAGGLKPSSSAAKCARFLITELFSTYRAEGFNGMTWEAVSEGERVGGGGGGCKLVQHQEQTAGEPFDPLPLTHSFVHHPPQLIASGQNQNNKRKSMRHAREYMRGITKQVLLYRMKKDELSPMKYLWGLTRLPLPPNSVVVELHDDDGLVTSTAKAARKAKAKAEAAAAAVVAAAAAAAVSGSPPYTGTPFSHAMAGIRATAVFYPGHPLREHLASSLKRWQSCSTAPAASPDSKPLSEEGDDTDDDDDMGVIAGGRYSQQLRCVSPEGLFPLLQHSSPSPSSWFPPCLVSAMPLPRKPDTPPPPCHPLRRQV